MSETNVTDLLELFAQGKTLGSLIRVPPGIGARLGGLETAVEAKRTSGSLIEQVAARQIEPFVRAARMLARRYDAVIANPPYMGSSYFNTELKKLLSKSFNVKRTDLYSVFIQRNLEMCKYLSMVTRQGWMTNKSYEFLREELLTNRTILNLVQLGANSFEYISGEVVRTCCFTLCTKHIPNHAQIYLDCSLGKESDKEKSLKDQTFRYEIKGEDFLSVPGKSIIFWVNEKVRSTFNNTPISEIADLREGIHTGHNETFLRSWWEVSYRTFSTNESSYDSIDLSKNTKWIPYNKGGSSKSWYGSNEFVIAFDENSRNQMSKMKGHVRPSQSLYFVEGGTWSDVGTKGFGVRYYPDGFLFDGAGPVVVGNEIQFIIALMNSSPFKYLAQILMPDLHYKCGTVKQIPFVKTSNNLLAKKIGTSAISQAKADWDSFETSWDFSSLPMLSNGELRTTNDDLGVELNGNAEDTQPPPANTMATAGNTSAPAPNTPPTRLNTMPPSSSAMPPATLTQTPAPFTMPPAENTMPPAQPAPPPSAKSPVEAAWNDWKQLCDWRIARMQQLETENNRLFIEAYGLEDELSPEVPLEQITLARADAEKDVRRLLSYFIGCLMGRYSLDQPGLIYADAGGAGFDSSGYRTFAADDDGIVPVTDIEWFQQDAARQFETFVKTVWGEKYLPANLRWIAEQLGGKAFETPTETVRRYFSGSFFKDHLQTYKKRPIYWLFSSGKQKAFECLVYLHRYNESTLPRMRHEYVLPLMSKLTAQIEILASSIESADSTSEKNKLTKQKEVLAKKQLELAQFDEKLRHTSDLRITLDLDDGVKVNYGKFGDLLAEVKQVAATKE